MALPQEVVDAAAFSTLNALFAEYFPVAPPVRSTPLVQLPRRLLFSIDAIAVVADPASEQPSSTVL